jgi:carboxylesterase type B
MFYLFGWLKAPADQPRDAQLVDQEQRYWAAFARTGNPNAPGLPVWAKSGVDGAYLDFASQGAVARTGLRKAACDVFARKTGQDVAALSAGRAVP